MKNFSIFFRDAEMFTEKSVVGMWILYCKDAYDPDPEFGCRSVNYRGEFSLLALASFFKQLPFPKVVSLNFE